jgi:hypothetical protein
MLFCMRTTLNLDDALMREAKKHAAETGTTLTDVIEQALRRSLGRSTEPAPTPFRMPVFQGGFGLAPGVTPEDLHSNARLAELAGDDYGL